MSRSAAPALQAGDRVTILFRVCPEYRRAYPPDLVNSLLRVETIRADGSIIVGSGRAGSPRILAKRKHLVRIAP